MIENECCVSAHYHYQSLLLIFIPETDVTQKMLTCDLLLHMYVQNLEELTVVINWIQLKFLKWILITLSNISFLKWTWHYLCNVASIHAFCSNFQEPVCLFVFSLCYGSLVVLTFVALTEIGDYDRLVG